MQLGVPEEIIEQHGAVSGECAIAMASGVAENLSSDYGLSITGFAGPEGGHQRKSCWHYTYWDSLSLWYLGKKCSLLGGRLDVKARAVNAALDWMRRLSLKQERANRGMGSI